MYVCMLLCLCIWISKVRLKSYSNEYPYSQRNTLKPTAIFEKNSLVLSVSLCLSLNVSLVLGMRMRVKIVAG